MPNNTVLYYTRIEQNRIYYNNTARSCAMVSYNPIQKVIVPKGPPMFRDGPWAAGLFQHRGGLHHGLLGLLGLATKKRFGIL